MIPYILCLVFVGVLGEQHNDSQQQLNLLDVKGEVKVVMDAARYYLNEGAPSITKLFVVDNAEHIRRLESKLKKKILEDLLDQLVDVWADINAAVLQDYQVLKNLHERSQALMKELQQRVSDVPKDEEIKREIIEKVKSFLKSAKKLFCIQERNFTGLDLAERQLFDLATRLEYQGVKIHLLRMVYDYKTDNLLNVPKDMSKEEYEELLEVWAMVSAWSKWSVLDLMAFIKEPLSDLHEGVLKYLNGLSNDLQSMIQETLDNVLVIASISFDPKHNGELASFTTINEVSDPFFVLCGQ